MTDAIPYASRTSRGHRVASNLAELSPDDTVRLILDLAAGLDDRHQRDARDGMIRAIMDRDRGDPGAEDDVRGGDGCA